MGSPRSTCRPSPGAVAVSVSTVFDSGGAWGCLSGADLLSGEMSNLRSIDSWPTGSRWSGLFPPLGSPVGGTNSIYTMLTCRFIGGDCQLACDSGYCGDLVGV